MVSEKLVIDSPLGIHLRPATAMCDMAVRYESKIYFEYNGQKTANAKSVISILASGVKSGEEILIVAEGTDEDEALQAVVQAFKQALNKD